MKNSTYKRYIVWGITVFTVVALSIVLFFILYRASGLGAAVRNIIRILQPIIYGAAFAYILNPVYRRIELSLTPRLIPRLRKEQRAVLLTRVLASIACLVIAFAVIWGVFNLLPQIFSSIFGIAMNMSGYLDGLGIWVERLAEENETIGPLVLEMYESITKYVESWLRTDLLPLLTNWLGLISDGVINVVRLVLNLFVGIIAMLYLLNGKHTFVAQGKKLLYSIFSVERANLIIENTRFAHHVFGGFISGKLLDSLIIGIICFIFMLVAKFPYAVLISVIIGVTNVIPFFGPFLGAIPSAILLLFENPMLCLYFVIFIIILQQIDGNIIGPKILGDTTGLPSFWVLFSILLFGGLFGFVGMLLAVPVTALLYSTVAALVNRRLYRRDLPTVTDEYRDLHHVEPQNRQFVTAERYSRAKTPVTSVNIGPKDKKPKPAATNPPAPAPEEPKPQAKPTEPEQD